MSSESLRGYINSEEIVRKCRRMEERGKILIRDTRNIPATIHRGSNLNPRSFAAVLWIITSFFLIYVDLFRGNFPS